MRFAGKYRIIHGIIGLKIVNVVLIHYFKADEERTRLRRAVEITGIAELALIQVFLEAVEYILHTGVQLELDVVVQHEGIVQLQVEVEELGRGLHAVFRDVPGIVRHNHLARIRAGEGEVEILQRSGREGEVAVIVGRAGHALGGQILAVHLCPDFLAGVAAALRGKAQLELHFLAVGNLGIEVGSVHAGAVAVAAFLDYIAHIVLTDVLEHEYVAQVGIETLYKDVRLPVSQVGGPVHRAAVTVGTLLAQVVRQLDLHAFAAYCGDVQVFIVGLRGTNRWSTSGAPGSPR